MPGKKFIQNRLVPGTGLFQQAGGIGGVVSHQGPHELLTPEGAISWTGPERFFKRFCQTGCPWTEGAGGGGASRCCQTRPRERGSGGPGRKPAAALPASPL